MQRNETPRAHRRWSARASLVQYRKALLYSAHRLRNQSPSRTTAHTLHSGCFAIDAPHNVGYYHHRQFVIEDFLPTWTHRILSTDKLSLESSTWHTGNATSTIYHVPLLKDKVVFSVETRVTEGTTAHDTNIFGLTSTELTQRKLLIADVCDDSLVEPDATGRFPDNPSRCRSSKTKRLPLQRGWDDARSPASSALTSTPCIRVHALIRARASIWPLQSKLESFIVQHLIQVFMRIQRVTVCCIDDWFDLSYTQALALDEIDARVSPSTDFPSPPRTTLTLPSSTTPPSSSSSSSSWLRARL